MVPMLTTLLAAAPLLAPAIPAPAIPALTIPPQGTPTVRTIVQAGDALSNGSTVLSIVDSTVADSGSWAALVRTSTGRAVLRDGALVLAVGGDYQGDPVVDINQVELSREGVLGVLYETPAPGGMTASKLRIGPDLLIDTGDPINYGFAGLSGVVIAIAGFDFEDSRAVLAIVSQSFFFTTETSLLAGSIASGSFVPDAGWKNGGSIPGLNADFEEVSGSLFAAPSGKFAAGVALESAGAPLHGVVVNAVGVAESGQPGPAPNTVWSFSQPPRIALGDGSGSILAGTVEPSSGGEFGVIYAGSTPVALEGAALNGVPGDPVAPFATAAVRLTDGGEPLFVVPFQSGRERLMAGSSVLVETGTPASPGTISSGAVVTNLLAGAPEGRLEATYDGSVLLVSGATTAGPSLFLVEREIGATVSCAAVPNSTGLIGDLRAEGSSYVVVNDLTLVGSDLPPNQFTLLVTSQDQQFVPNPGGSAGNLCIGPDIGRFNAQILPVGAGGEVEFDVDLTMIPRPSTITSGVPGDTWLFQTWHRDVSGGSQTSNYTRAVAVTLR